MTDGLEFDDGKRIHSHKRTVLRRISVSWVILDDFPFLEGYSDNIHRSPGSMIEVAILLLWPNCLTLLTLLLLWLYLFLQLLLLLLLLIKLAPEELLPCLQKVLAIVNRSG